MGYFKHKDHEPINSINEKCWYCYYLKENSLPLRGKEKQFYCSNNYSCFNNEKFKDRKPYQKIYKV